MTVQDGTAVNQSTSSSAAGSGAAGTSGAGQPSVSSGSASSALIAAAEAASSAAGDTSTSAGSGSTGATSGASGQQAATGTTPQTGTAAGQQTATGQAPENRIVAAVENARKATRAEVEKEMQQRYAPFQGLKPEDVQIAMGVLTELRTNPEKFFQELGERINGGGVGTGTEEAYPEADLVSKDGKLKSYTDGTIQKLLDVHGKRVTAQVMKQLKPFISHIETAQSREQQQAAEAQNFQRISSHLAEMRQEPHFTKENEPAILEVLGRLTPEQKLAFGDSPTERATRALEWAYRTFLKEKVFPSIDASAEKRVREGYQRKVHTTTGSVSPTQTGGDPAPVQIKNVEGLAAHMERMAREATAAS